MWRQAHPYPSAASRLRPRPSGSWSRCHCVLSPQPCFPFPPLAPTPRSGCRMPSPSRPCCATNARPGLSCSSSRWRPTTARMYARAPRSSASALPLATGSKSCSSRCSRVRRASLRRSIRSGRWPGWHWFACPCRSSARPEVRPCSHRFLALLFLRDGSSGISPPPAAC